MKYSFVVPVYNRPDEVEELLESLGIQTFNDFEVVLVDDGSTIPCRSVCEKFADLFPVRYFEKPNSGPGPTRNYGVARACGEFVLILDSDVVLPPTYLAEVEAELQQAPCDAFGGADCAHPDFTPTQKAINYAMTSFFTTGGIRGRKGRKLDKFYPRSFNLGVKREVYETLGGFAAMRFGEDIDFSLRIFEAGYSCRLFPGAWVWHKRRTDLRKFFKQVHNSGIARIHLMKRHPGSLKFVHLLPAAFTLGCFFLLVAWLCFISHPWSALFLLPLVLFAVVIFTDAALKERNPGVALRAVAASFVQLCAYGTGFLRSWWNSCVLRRGEMEAFKKTFYQ